MFLLVLNKFPCPSASINVFLFVCKPIKHIDVIPLLKASAALGVVGAGVLAPTPESKVHCHTEGSSLEL